MRRHSIEASPSDPRVIAAAEQGITAATIEAACVEAHASDTYGRIKPGFVLAIAERWTLDAQRMQSLPPARASPSASGQRAHFDERSADRKRAYVALTGGRAGAEVSPDVIDVEAAEVRNVIPKH